MTTTEKLQEARNRHRDWVRKELRIMLADELRYEALQLFLHDLATEMYDLGMRHGASTLELEE